MGLAEDITHTRPIRHWIDGRTCTRPCTSASASPHPRRATLCSGVSPCLCSRTTPHSTPTTDGSCVERRAKTRCFVTLLLPQPPTKSKSHLHLDASPIPTPAFS